MAAGAQVVSRGRPHGKGGNVSAAAEAALERRAGRRRWSCSATATSAPRRRVWRRWSRRSRRGSATSRWPPSRAGSAAASASPSASPSWAIRRLCGFETQAPISGQRALRAESCARCLPFAAGFGMEIGMTVDAVRAGYRLGEYELDLEHRATGRSLAGFLHRGRQLRDFARAYAERR